MISLVVVGNKINHFDVVLAKVLLKILLKLSCYNKFKQNQVYEYYLEISNKILRAVGGLAIVCLFKKVS